MPVRGRKEIPPNFLSRATFLLPAGIVLFFDQLTKKGIEASLEVGQSIPLWSPFFYLTHVKNQGIAFGFFQNGENLLLGLITFSIGTLVVMGLRLHPPRAKTQIALGFILGGAVGNWVDRIRIGAVVDFLDFRVWPVFNLADTAISVGVGLFLLDFFKKHAT